MRSEPPRDPGRFNPLEYFDPDGNSADAAERWNRNTNAQINDLRTMGNKTRDRRHRENKREAERMRVRTAHNRGRAAREATEQRRLVIQLEESWLEECADALSYCHDQLRNVRERIDENPMMPLHERALVDVLSFIRSGVRSGLFESRGNHICPGLNTGIGGCGQASTWIGGFLNGEEDFSGVGGAIDDIFSVSASLQMLSFFGAGSVGGAARIRQTADGGIEIDDPSAIRLNRPLPSQATTTGDVAGEFVDPAARRVYLRVATRESIQESAPRTAGGDFVDPNTGQVIPRDGPFDYGHKPGYEWWRAQQIARDEGWTRPQVIAYENNPTHYQIEAPGANRGHQYEMPR